MHQGNTTPEVGQTVTLIANLAEYKLIYTCHNYCEAYSIFAMLHYMI